MHLRRCVSAIPAPRFGPGRKPVGLGQKGVSDSAVFRGRLEPIYARADATSLPHPLTYGDFSGPESSQPRFSVLNAPVSGAFGQESGPK